MLVYSTTEPVISPASHMFQSGFFFSLRGVKEILNKMVFVNWAEVGGGKVDNFGSLSLRPERNVIHPCTRYNSA